MAGLYGLRVADQVRLEHGNDEVGVLYTALGECDPSSVVAGPRSPTTRWRSCRVCLKSMRICRRSWPMPRSTSRTIAYIRSETDLAFERTGKDVGTPIITFHPGQPTRPASSAR